MTSTRPYEYATGWHTVHFKDDYSFLFGVCMCSVHMHSHVPMCMSMRELVLSFYYVSPKDWTWSDSVASIFIHRTFLSAHYSILIILIKQTNKQPKTKTQTPQKIPSTVAHAYNPAVGRWRRQGKEPNHILRYLVSSRPALDTWDPVLK